MTAEELISILRQGEGTRVEFKSDFPAQSHAIGKEMAAFANSGGGTLLMGVTDEGAPIGIEHADRVVERLAGIARACSLTVSPEIDKFQISKNIIIVYVKVKPSAPCIYEGKVYQRIGSTSVECNSGEQLIAIIQGNSARAIEPGKVAPVERNKPQRNGRKLRKTTEIEFFQLLTKRPEEAIVARKILDWASKNFSLVKWERSSFNPVLEYGAKFSHNPITVLSNKTPRVVIKFGRMKRRNRIPEVKLAQLLQRLNKIDGVNLPLNSLDKYPHIKLSTLMDETALRTFLRCINWTSHEVKVVLAAGQSEGNNETDAPTKVTHIKDKPLVPNVNRKLRIAQLIEFGRVHPGDKMKIAGKVNSDAVVIDAKRVRLTNGQVLTWNEYGQKFTGHVAVNIYRHVTINGVPLESIR
jgi:hypothetical protein